MRHDCVLKIKLTFLFREEVLLIASLFLLERAALGKLECLDSGSEGGLTLCHENKSVQSEHLYNFIISFHLLSSGS